MVSGKVMGMLRMADGRRGLPPSGRPAFTRPAAPLRSSCPEAWGGSWRSGGGGVRVAGVRRGQGRSGLGSVGLDLV